LENGGISFSIIPFYGYSKQKTKPQLVFHLTNEKQGQGQVQTIGRSSCDIVYLTNMRQAQPV
jgi:hypothetical protein